MSKEQQINKYISQWYDWLLNEVSKNIANGMMSEYREDLLHHIILDLYNLPDAKINQMVTDDKLRWYLLRGAALQLKSSTSPFYRIWRRHKLQVRENYTHNGEHDSFSGKGILEQIYEPYEITDWELCFRKMWDNELNFYQKTLLQRKFMDKWSYQEMFEYYQISKRHMIKDINETIIQIRTKCNCNE